MIDERQEELASLYALGLLEGVECVDFERALATDAELRSLVRELREASAALALAAPHATAPAALKSRVLTSIGATSAGNSARENVVHPPASVFRSLIPWAIAACFALAAAWFGRLYVSSTAEAERLRTEAALAELALKSKEQQLEAERLISREQLAQLDLANVKIAALASLANSIPEARAVAVYNPVRQEGVFALEKMPPLASDQQLELWVIEDKADAKPVSAGVFDLRSGDVTRVQFKPSAAVGAVKTFAVSREKKDGVRAHASPSEVIMAGQSF
jgi:anti-sigma-K factor RskA